MKRVIGFVLPLALLAVGASGETLINAAGATFPYPMYSKWFDEFHKKYPDVQINYQSIGSGGGIKQVTEGTVDFGAADVPMTPELMKTFTEKRKCNILHFPTVMGADVLSYNVPGVTQELNFTPEAIAGIFLGKITKWNDPALTQANPGVKLTGNPIVVIHRAEASGTTYIFVDFLSKISKEWETKVGRAASVQWPVGLGSKGNEGVAGQIKQTPYSIGYIELIYAVQNNMSYGKVKNPAGVFVKASLAGVSAAAAGAIKEIPDDFRVSITNAPGKDSYPISSFTWLLVPDKIADPTKKKAITELLKWVLSDGQNMTEVLSYARLPKAVVAKEQKAISKIQ